MNIVEEPAYWIALSHLKFPGGGVWRIKKINTLILDILNNKKISLSDFFKLEVNDLINQFGLTNDETNSLTTTKSEIPNLAFLAENLINEGFEIIPFVSDEYPKILKENLGIESRPPILYIKGNKDLFNWESIAIVGSRNASEISLKFTENLTKALSKQFKVIVSGFAKGVDKKALDSAVENNGNTIAVLPQGILTFSSGFKKYYPQLVEGQFLVVSTFFPKVPWSVQLAMARNVYIYGLAKEIYVAESGPNGGTWNGALDGLRKGRKVYVRMPDKTENNSNELLIQKGAIPVDFYGIPIEKKEVIVSETKNEYNIEIDERIKKILDSRVLSAKEINDKLNLGWNVKKLSNYLSSFDFIMVDKSKKPFKFKLKNSDLEPGLFS